MCVVILTQLRACPGYSPDADVTPGVIFAAVPCRVRCRTGASAGPGRPEPFDGLRRIRGAVDG